MKRCGRLVLVALLATSPLGAVARAEDGSGTSDRERGLERRVEELEKQLAEVNRRLSDSGGDRSGDALAARIEELEKLTRKDENGLFGYWKSGTYLESGNKAFRVKIGGIVQNDWAWFASNQDVEAATGSEVEAGTEFRRARLHVAGTLYGNVDFMAEYDFAGGTAGFRHVWMATRVPWLGRVQVGSMKEPYGLEEQTSDPFVTFLERSTATEAFSPAFNTGLLVTDTFAEDRVTWAVGVFRDAGGNGNDVGNERSGEGAFTGRIVGRPWIGDDGDRYVHVGGAASVRSPTDRTVAYSSRPEMHLAPVLVNTGPMDAGRAWLYEMEAAFVLGPFSTAAEYHGAFVDRRTVGDVGFHAFAAQASWFLTGEHRPYDAQKGAFGRVAPKCNYGESGMGAWEVAFRWDAIDLDDGAVAGGLMQVRTFGVNWYLNPNTKVALDWVHARIARMGELDGLEVRFQVDF